MGNPIKFDDLIDKQSIEAGFVALKNELKKAEKELIASAKNIKKATEGIKLTDTDAANQLDKNKTAVKSLRKEVDLNRKAQDQLATAQNKLRISQSNVGIETAKVRDTIQRQNRVTKEQITLNRTTQGSMTALGIELGRNRKRYRDLSAAQRANANVGGKLLTTIRQQDTEIKKLDASIGNNQRSVGNYGVALKGVTRLLGALGLAGGIALVVRGMRDMIGIFSGFEKQAAKVRAISGATDEEFRQLTDDAKRLGESTEKTATQVGELQLAFAKLGFTTEQIIAATEATLDLSTAIDEDLAESARVVGNVLRGFDLEAEETARITDVMALAFSSSALDLSKFSVAMSQVAPVAKTFGFSVEDTTALLAQLTNAGFDASKAGTATRNILLNLADANGKLAQRLGEPVRTLPQLIDALAKLEAEGVDLNETLQLTDKRSVAAFNTFIRTGDAALQMADDLKNASGSARVMAEIMRDTLAGDTDIAISAIQGLIIEIGEKLTPILRAIVKGFTFFINNLGDFIKIVGIAGVGLAAYTLITKGAAIAQRAYTLAVNIANAATKAFSTTVKASPLGLLLGLLAAATAAYFAFRDSTDAATKAQGRFSEKHKPFLDELAKEEAQLRVLFDSLKKANEGTEERSVVITEINRLYGEYLPNLLTEKSTLEEIAVAQEIATKALIQDIAVKSKQNELTEITTKKLTTEREALRGFAIGLQAAIRDLQDPNKFVGSVNDRIRELAVTYGVSAGKIGIAYSAIGDANFEFATGVEETNAFYNEFIDSLDLSVLEIEKTKEAIRSLIKIQEVLLKQAKLLPETTEKELVIKNRRVKLIEIEIKRLKSLGIEQGKQIDLDKIRIAITLARVRNIEDEIKRVKVAEEVKFKLKKDALDKERDALIKAGGDRIEINKLFNRLEEELLIEFERVRAEKRREVVLKVEKELSDDILKQLEIDLLERGKKEDDINKALLDKKIELLEQELELRKDIGSEIIDQELELARLREQREKEHQENLNEIRDFAIDEAIKALQRKADAAIRAADEEIAATEKQISRQEVLAAQGLENSLKFEQEARAEALLAKIEAEKQKERAEKITAFWNLLSNSDSVQEAIAKFGIGEAFARTIEAIPAFKEGGPTPDKESLVRVSEDGSEYIVKHGPAQQYLPQLQAMNSGTYDDTLGYIDRVKFLPENTNSTAIDAKAIGTGMAAIEQAVKDNVPKIESAFNATTKHIITILKYGNGKKTIYQKLPRGL